MPRYLRSRLAGGTYFFTVVTAHRQPLLCRDGTRTALRGAVAAVRSKHPFDVVAWVLLPDHLHCIWTLPPGDSDFSGRWSAIKRRTTLALGRTLPPAARSRHRDGDLWQRRFWEHTIRDEADLTRHVDYIHWNPVRHGLVTEAALWPYSTFHRWVRDGLYPSSWEGGDARGFEVPE